MVRNVKLNVLASISFPKLVFIEQSRWILASVVVSVCVPTSCLSGWLCWSNFQFLTIKLTIITRVVSSGTYFHRDYEPIRPEPSVRFRKFEESSGQPYFLLLTLFVRVLWQNCPRPKFPFLSRILYDKIMFSSYN